MPGTVAILTDFGSEDTYVGAMKAVILSIASDLQIVDVTHAIQPQNIREGAFALLNCYRYFPQGTVFCAVVDPGVGSERLPVAAQCGSYYFVAPDNGILSYAIANMRDPYQAVALENPRYQLDNASDTFHGRDIFAPAAASLAANPSRFESLGRKLDTITPLPKPLLTFARQRIIGEVMRIDHFGNVITSIGMLRWMDAENLSLKSQWDDDMPVLQFDSNGASAAINGNAIHSISRAYHKVQLGALLAQIDSSGFLEIAANQGNAAERLSVQMGDKVILRLSPP